MTTRPGPGAPGAAGRRTSRRAPASGHPLRDRAAPRRRSTPPARTVGRPGYPAAWTRCRGAPARRRAASARPRPHPDRNAPSPGHLDHLAHRILQQPPTLRDAPKGAHRRPGHGAHPTGRRDEGELLPQGDVDLRGRLDPESTASAKGLLQPADPLGHAPVELPERDPRIRARVSDPAGADQERDHPAETAEHALPAQRLGQDIRRLHPVEDGEHGRLRTHHRPQGPGRLPELPSLRGHDHRVGRPRLRRIVGSQRGTDLRIAGDALQAEPMPTDGLQVRTPGDEDHLLPGLGQPGTEVPADPARAEDRHAHRSGGEATRLRGARATGPSGCGGGSRPDPTPPSEARRSHRP